MYKIIMNKADFFKIHNRIATKNIEIIKEEVKFEVNHDALRTLKNIGYPYVLVDSFKIKSKLFLKKYYMVLIGFVFLFSLIYINNYRVSKIIFNTDTPINAEIEDRINSSIKDLFWFSFSNEDYTKLSKELRVQYSEYPYIEVYSKNNKIYVDIYTYHDEYPELEDDQGYGSIVSKKDAVIDYFYIHKGNSLISKNKYVKKGDVLVDGYINGSYIGAKGLVMGYTYESIDIVVNKVDEFEIETMNVDSYTEINFFGNKFNFGKDNEFSISEISKDNVFNLFDVFSIKKIEEVEKNVIIEENSLEAAIEKGKKVITENFNKNKTSSEEEMIDLYYYRYSESEDSYTITYIAKKLESIGIFKESSIDEAELTNWKCSRCEKHFWN